MAFFRKARLLGFLLILIAAAWTYAKLTDPRETIIRNQTEQVRVSDGDSFAIGTRRIRLTGIDAPELKQTCKDATGADWACGIAAHGKLVQLLARPDLRCIAQTHDRFGRALAKCSTAEVPDIAAEMAAKGFAVSYDFNGIREYGREEDSARSAKRGIWRGQFESPKKWRDEHASANIAK